MADFKQALDNLIGEEGGYVNNPHDAGGETVFGIARASHPQWAGWPLVDALKRQFSNLVDLNRQLKESATVQDAVQSFYRAEYWSFDSVESQAVANKLLSIDVLFGRGHGTQILQTALVRLGFHIDVDGQLGAKTLNALQKAKEPDILHALRTYSALYIAHRLIDKPDQVVFAEGWFWRVTS